MSFNPSYNDIVTAYADGKSAKNNTTGARYHNYQKAEVTKGELDGQVDGKFGGSEFNSDDGTIEATSHPGIRGMGFDATLLKTSDGIIVLFY